MFWVVSVLKKDLDFALNEFMLIYAYLMLIR